MKTRRDLRLFDKDVETDIQSRFLPHWFQPGVAIFVTFRTADSMPGKIVERWKKELQQWLRQIGIPFDPEGNPPAPETVPDHQRSEYLKQRNRLWQWHLDTCHGACVLKRPENAKTVMQSLLHFNGDRYDMTSAIVMPNHVHLIAQFYPPTTCRQQCTSWMHYTARIINRRIGCQGAFWQSEPFDHLIRSERQFHYLQRYIADNGRNANLPETDYLYWIDPMLNDAPSS